MRSQSKTAARQHATTAICQALPARQRVTMGTHQHGNAYLDGVVDLSLGVTLADAVLGAVAVELLSQSLLFSLQVFDAIL